MNSKSFELLQSLVRAFTAILRSFYSFLAPLAHTSCIVLISSFPVFNLQ